MSPLAIRITSLVADGYSVAIYAEEGEAEMLVSHPNEPEYVVYLGEFGGSTDELIQAGASIFYSGE